VRHGLKLSSLWTLLPVLFALATTAVGRVTPTISYAEAASHVGEVVVVEGVISDVGFSARSQTTFLNMGGRYPNHAFTAVIFRSARPLFPDARSWEGRRLRIRGLVKLYRGKPEIVLEVPSQISLVGE
jgi:DNA/RNA endonuclease YhcR with UshA esterase domain